MAQSLTSNRLIASIKRRAFIPDNQVTFTDEDFLAFATEELEQGLVPYILRHHEDYFLQEEFVPLIANQSDYKIPSRAIGNKLREISYRDSNSNLYEMTRIEVQDAVDYDGSFFSGNLVSAFYIFNNKVRIVPPLTSQPSGDLVMTYFMRRNELVPESRAATITSIDTVGGVIGVNTIPTDDLNVPLFSAATKLDFIMAETPHVTLGFDITPQAVNTTTNIITIDPTSIPADLEVGDYVNLACETIVPQIPADLHMQLAQRTAVRCLEAMGDTEGVQVGKASLTELEDKGSSLIDNRVEGAPRKVVNRDGLLRDGLYRRRFRFRS